MDQNASDILDISTMRMNSHEGKAILAMIREGDYAHAGEEESIQLVLDHVPQRPTRAILDVGCGRGGTADYIRRQGWGPICGLDIDEASIDEARQRYPLVRFHTADVERLSEHLKEKFGVFFLFNAFYVFPNQALALEQLRNVADDAAILAVFDYTDPAGQFERREPSVARFEHWQPLNLSRLPAQLAQTGWVLDSVEDLSGRYLDWYRQLVGKIQNKRAAIIEQNGKTWYDFVECNYSDLLHCIEQGWLGGAMVLAKAS